MNKKLYDKKQQELLDAFFKEFFTSNSNHLGMWIVTGFFILIHGIFMVVPYQSMNEGDYHFKYILILGYCYYLFPYMQLMENNKTQRIYEKIKYLPISLTQLRIYRIRKLLRFCLRLLIVFMVGQLFFSLVVYHEITLTNICYPLVWGFLFPFGLTSICTFFVK